MTDNSDWFTGVYPAMCTPFNENGEIDYQTLIEDARRLEESGVSGLVPMGSTGESATVSHDEHIEVIEAVSDEVSIPVIAGSGSNSTKEALSLSQRAVDAGADALLLISPYYNKPESDGFLNHYQTIADNVGVPQVVYNVPSRTGREIPPETVIELSSHSNIIGYKAAGGDLSKIGQIVEESQENQFSVLSGNDGETLPIISVGGSGCISVAANVVPNMMSELVESAISGDYKTAQELHHELGPLFRALFWETNPIPVKEAMKYFGYSKGNLRLPLTEMSSDKRQEFYTVLSQYK